MPFSEQQRADIHRQFARGDQRTKTIVPLFCGGALLVAVIGLAVKATWLATIGLAVALTTIVLTVVGVVMKAWIRRRV
jgi:hypothetical protein